MDIVVEKRYAEPSWYTLNISIGGKKNRDLPKEERIEAQVLPMSGRDYDAWLESGGDVVKGDSQNLVQRGRELADRLIRERCIGLRNLTFKVEQDDGTMKEHAPTTGKELLDFFAKNKIPMEIESLIYEDINEAIRNVSTLKEGLLDKPGPR